MSLKEIDAATKVYAEAHQLLVERSQALTEGIEMLKRDHLPGIRRALDRAAEKEAALRALVEAQPERFTRPRTVVMYGIKVGLKRGSGKLEFSDGDQVVKLIKKHLPDQADFLITTTEKPAKAALAQLSVKQLRALACDLQGTGDVVVVQPVDSEVDKLVTALLKAAAEEAAA